MNSLRTLLVGSGRVASVLAPALRKSGVKTAITTRTKSQSPLYESFDLLKPSEIRRTLRSFEPNRLIICAGISGVDACNREPELSHKVNVEGVSKLLDVLEEEGIPTLFLSSSLIWDIIDSNTNKTPSTLYAKQKLLVERYILESKFCEVDILRVGKIIDSQSPIIKKINDILQGRETPVYADYPLALVHATSFLSTVIEWLSQRCYQNPSNLVSCHQFSEYELVTQFLISKGTGSLPQPQYLKMSNSFVPGTVSCPQSEKYITEAKYGHAAIDYEMNFMIEN